jgi:AcrR family transcriptional regulator
MIEVAEQLFAERGIDAVSSAQILEASGQRNKNAVRYHFGSKDGLVTAVAEYRSGSLNARRSELLDELRAQGRERDGAAVCTTLVLPLAELLDDPDNHFLGFLARYHLDRSRRRLVNSVDPRLIESYRDAARLLRRTSPLNRTDFEARYALVLDMIFTALAGREAEERNEEPSPASRTVLIRNLVGSAADALQVAQ